MNTIYFLYTLYTSNHSGDLGCWFFFRTWIFIEVSLCILRQKDHYNNCKETRKLYNHTFNRKNAINHQSNKVTKRTQTGSQFTKSYLCLQGEILSRSLQNAKSHSTLLQCQNSVSWVTVFAGYRITETFFFLVKRIKMNC